MSERKVKEARRASEVAATQSDPPLSRWRRVWQWLNNNGGALGIIFVAIPMVFGAVWVVFSAYSRLGALEEMISGKNGLAERINGRDGLAEKFARIETKLDIIEKYILSPLKKEAVALGIEDPQLTTISLSPSSPPITIRSPRGDYLEIRILEVGADFVKFSLNGEYGKLIFDGSTVILSPVKTDAPINLTSIFGDLTPTFGFYGLYLVILDFPTKDTAIVATGPKRQGG